MKNYILLSILFFSLYTSAQNSNWCGTDKILQDLKNSNPGFEEHMHKSMIKASRNNNLEHLDLEKATLNIPVVVHIIHDNGIGNITDAQIQDALTILNADYNRQNADAANTRNSASAPFQPIAGLMDVKFKLAKIDPDGNCTNGIVRVNAPELTYNANDDCKYNANGGSDQWPMDQYVNIWVVNSIENDGGAGTILGYAYLPYWPNGNNYGILIRNDAFGTVGTAATSDGRTLTHEMGHLLGLNHIFDAGWSGTSGCHTDDCYQAGDYCCDTPPQEEANWSCSFIWNSCPEIPTNDAFGFDANDQIENYMSYNSCQNMFSGDQVGLMQQNFIDISFMANIVSAANVLATGINEPDILCKAEFDASKKIICNSDTVQLTDWSFQNPTSWTWTISPGTENVDWVYVSSSNSNSQNPTVQFLTQGVYQVELTASDGVTSDTEIKSQYITVFPAAQTIPYWEGFEGFSSFPSTDNWLTYNPDNNNAFAVEQNFGLSGSHCAKLMNYGQSGSNSDELISSSIDLSVVNPTTETVTLSFRYAYRKRYASNDEWLKVFISGDCGESWVQRKTLHGDQLSSIVFPSTWSPSLSSDWTTVHMTNVTSNYFVENFRFKFEFEGQGGNNFYLDDINLYKGSPSNTIVLGIAEEGQLAEFSVYPNPAEDELNLRFSLFADAQTIIQIRDVSGKIVQNLSINGASGSNLVMLNTSGLSNGMYFLTVNAGDAQSTLQFVVK